MFDIGSGPASRSPFVAVRNFHEGQHPLILNEQYFWPNVVATEHVLPHLTSVDLWPNVKVSSSEVIFWQRLVATEDSLLYVTSVDL